MGMAMQPAQIGIQFSAEVKDLTVKGLGVVQHPDGRVFFVRGAWTGDVGEFTPISIKKKYGLAKIKTITKASPDRVSVACAHHGLEAGQCGGCPWMGISYPAQLMAKQKLIFSQLNRNEIDIAASQIQPIHASPQEFSYRNRIQLKTDGKQLGFVSSETKTFAPIKKCIVANPALTKLVDDLNKSLPRKDWQPEGRYLWSLIEVDDSLPSAKDVVANKRLSFRQANDYQNSFMKKWLKTKLEKMDKKIGVIELFCGDGNFTTTLSDLGFNSILACEASQPAVAKLKAKALTGVTAMDCDLYRASQWKSLSKLCANPSLLILDPPREGFSEIEKFLQTFDSLSEIFYISCDISTLAREIGQLNKKGWSLIELQPVDQFPQTPHVECLVHLKKTHLK